MKVLYFSLWQRMTWIRMSLEALLTQWRTFRRNCMGKIRKNSRMRLKFTWDTSRLAWLIRLDRDLNRHLTDKQIKHLISCGRTVLTECIEYWFWILICFFMFSHCVYWDWKGLGTSDQDLIFIDARGFLYASHSKYLACIAWLDLHRFDCIASVHIMHFHISSDFLEKFFLWRTF